MMSALISLVIIVPAVAFWIWMFWDMATNPSVSPRERPFWFIGFLFVGLLTAGYYFFTEYRKK